MSTDSIRAHLNANYGDDWGLDTFAMHAALMAVLDILDLWEHPGEPNPDAISVDGRRAIRVAIANALRTTP